MGGRGSGGGKGGGGGGAAKKIPTGEGITDKNELINLYNSISGNSNLTVEQRVKAMHDIEERIKEVDTKKQADLKQKRLDALAKARAKRAENKKNGIKPEKKEKDPGLPFLHVQHLCPTLCEPRALLNIPGKGCIV